MAQENPVTPQAFPTPPTDPNSGAPLDAANRSLADALRTSFGILKLVMFVLVVVYCFSGVRCIEEDQQAVVFRFGKLLEDVRNPGLSWAFPFPVDETVTFTTKRNNPMTVSHWPNVPPNQINEPLDMVRSSGGLDPALDRALLTSDRGMVHVRWAGQYRINDLKQYVLNVGDQNTEQVEDFIKAAIENAAIKVVSEYSAMEVTRGGSSMIASLVRSRVNDVLASLDTGVELVALDIPRSSVPGQTISAFNQVSTAQNQRENAIRKAIQQKEQRLTNTAGGDWERFIQLLDKREAADAKGDAETLAAANTELDDFLEVQLAGEAGAKLQDARSFATEIEQSMQADLREFQVALEEYEEAPDLFIARMYEWTQRRVLTNENVIKNFVSPFAKTLWIHVPPDPKQRQLDEMRQLQQEEEARKSFRPTAQRRFVE